MAIFTIVRLNGSKCRRDQFSIFQHLILEKKISFVNRVAMFTIVRSDGSRCRSGWNEEEELGVIPVGATGQRSRRDTNNRASRSLRMPRNGPETEKIGNDPVFSRGSTIRRGPMMVSTRAARRLPSNRKLERAVIPESPVLEVSNRPTGFLLHVKMKRWMETLSTVVPSRVGIGQGSSTIAWTTR